MHEKLKDVLRKLVCLGKHGVAGLHQDVQLREVHHFLRHVEVADAALGCLEVRSGNSEVVDGVLETVLVGTELGPLAGNPVNGTVDYGDGAGGGLSVRENDILAIIQN